MKKILLTALSAMFLLFSCSQDDLSDVQQQDFDEAVSQFTKEYEIKVLGLGFEGKDKDEITPSLTEESQASNEFISFIKDSLERAYSKTSVKQTKISNDFHGYVGVLKHSTCGSYREFQYYQDNEDGGWTSTRNSGASYADGNKNMNWTFCLVPGHVREYPISPNYNPSTQTPYWYGGGVLLLYKYSWNSGHGDVDVVHRYHDDEDHRNKNGIRDFGGHRYDPGNYVGDSFFGTNTGLTWRFSDRARNFSLPFRYGVLTNDFNGSEGDINIDDENGSNANYAVIRRYRAGSSSYELREVRGRDERFRGTGIWNTNTSYYIKWYN